jgi:threonine/homoserine/homoserine lactone efflux protein
MLEILTAGAVLGLSAGLSPGPMLALVASETLARGRAAGLAVSAAPLLSDGPIIAATIFLLGRIEDSQAALGLLQIAGGGLLASYSWAAFRTPRHEPDEEPSRPRLASSLAKGVAVNFLNPSPYLFWLTIGTPLLLTAWDTNHTVAVLFLVLFYLGLVGSKSILAVLFARSRSVLEGTRYVWVTRFLGAVLLLYAALFFRDGVAKILAA